jgi:glycosyltransferase involved in cell wall biosynthesis
MKPEVSVVMAVHDEEIWLGETLDSVLSQSGPSIEVVVVDDGSTDGSGAILRRYAEEDPRVRLFEREHRGLTRALIEGCAVAEAEFIARQDAADVSRPGRLAAQHEALMSDPKLAFVSCWTDVCGPEWEYLYTQRGTGRAVRPLEVVGRENGRAVLLDFPPHHGSVMFRKRAYEAVGGYREAFYLAQDRDLWFRLAEAGRLQVLARACYAARVLPDSRTSTHREVQLRLGRIARRAFEARREGASEAELLREASGLRPAGRPDPRSRAAAHYFVGEALRRNGDARCLRYFRRSLALDPLEARAWARFAQAGARQGLALLGVPWGT